MLKILLIEDELIIAADVKINLENNNFAKVFIAKNYQKAKQLFEANLIDLIISDVQLNDVKDGIDIIKEFSEIRKFPVVYLTAYSDEETISRIEQTMPFAYILKPYNIKQLKSTINLAILNSQKQSKSFKADVKNSEKLKLLTSREKEVLVILSAGKLSKEIAEILNISIYTVEQHKKNIKKKLELKTVGELVNFTLSTELHTFSDY